MGALTFGGCVADDEEYLVQPYVKRSGALEAGELIRCPSAAAAFRRGKQMSGRVAGAVFYRIETSASGDQWTEVEVLATIGDVPQEDAA